MNTSSGEPDGILVSVHDVLDGFIPEGVFNWMLLILLRGSSWSESVRASCLSGAIRCLSGTVQRLSGTARRPSGVTRCLSGAA